MSTTEARTDATSASTGGTADRKRVSGRVDAGETSFASAHDLMEALIRAATAHGEHEKRTGRRDEEWPVWYAAYMVAEQSGAELPL
jgi:hypothetical protein